MALLKRINPFSRKNDDTGFGTNPNGFGGRFINRDGSFNIRREGRPFMYRFNIYHALLNLPAWKFGCVILLFYFSINLLYTSIYWMLGPEQLQGIIGQTTWAKFKELFFFSTETFTTVGYGRVNPIGDGANMTAAIEAMSGFLSFAVATGLIYGRFSRPRAHLLFSDEALIAPFKGKTALMFRFASYKEHHTLTNVEVLVTAGLQIQDNGNAVYQFYTLSLERNKIESLSMNWTVVHTIDDDSPLLGFSAQDLENADVEIYVTVRGFNDVYANTVIQRTSYTYQEITFNRKFIPMYRESENGKTTILELHHLNTSKPIEDPGA
ncbi:inward rectifier potassium channel [Chitinophaga niastensis]|uniref:Inward rectifier potassium channel n=1 Tax=Chitinophaga niastensis TaxID=536980 RepID=A0A2P8HC79_CHINA|nr:ion channel [Chitinophaga niastensis]PSL43804.1 inward rectifier potassium channel [Chitinophaga niastensis]